MNAPSLFARSPPPAAGGGTGWGRWLWPTTLFGRVTLILLIGLIIAHALSFIFVALERTQAARVMMIAYVSKDLASSVAILDRLPADERASWLDKLERRNYRYVLGAAQRPESIQSEQARAVAASVTAAFHDRRRVSIAGIANRPDQIAVRLRLADGTPLTIELTLAAMEISPWVIAVLALQLALLVLFSWLAIRLLTRPLTELARAADALGTHAANVPLAETGPLEVARAAKAFNAMQRRIAEQLAERVRLLAAISHDLQTPLTRMRLRAELMDDAAARDKFFADLSAMQALVEEGIAYARDGRGVTEPPRRVDLDSLLDSLVCDYADAGKLVRLSGQVERSLILRPLAVRRIVSNLLDNALKFGEDVELHVGREGAGHVCIRVIDRGPGIPPDQLEAVLQPFYRLEASRNRDTGGTGLGLAIAQQLVSALEGTLTLSNREGGGLEACLRLPAGS